MKTLLMALTLFVVSATCYALPEVQYEANFATRVVPFMVKYLHQDILIAADGKKIAYATCLNSPAAPSIVFVPGRTEFYLKYLELAFDFFQKGYNVFMIDPRGQGLSERLVVDPQMGYVTKFEDYVSDLNLFMQKVVKPQSAGKVFLLGHSMGGAIATLYVASHPDGVAALALTSAMFLPQTKPYTEIKARGILFVLEAIGDAKKYAPGKGPYTSAPNNDTTHSAERFDFYKRLIEAMPELAIGGPATHWVSEALKASRQIRGDTSTKIKVPMMMINAAVDHTVVTSVNEAFCKKVSGCSTVTIPNTSHEILTEKDAVRDLALSTLFTFFENH